MKRRLRGKSKKTNQPDLHRMCTDALEKDRQKLHELAQNGYEEDGRGIVAIKFTITELDGAWLKRFEHVGYTSLEEMRQHNEEEKYCKVVESYDPRMQAVVVYLCHPSNELHYYVSMQ